MKCLFIQLSDMHCSSSADEYTQKIDQAVAAIKSKGPFDSIILIFSGDLTNQADKNEFKAAKKVIGRFVSQIASTVQNVFIPIMIVPGNHDMFLPEDSRTAAVIEKWNKDEHLQSETDRLNDFFMYSRSKNCFRGHKLYDIKILDVGGVNMQFCLLNSAPYSTRKPDDKQFHYFPSYVADKLARDPKADIKITVMHHHFEWCEPETKEMIRSAISSDDMTFFGHDHKAEALTTEYANGERYNIIMGGAFDLAQKKSASFNAVIYDSESMSFERFAFIWSTEDCIFHPQSCGSFFKRRKSLTPNDQYIRDLKADSQGFSESFTDYYVLPKLRASGNAFSDDEFSSTVDVDGIFEALKKDKAIQIVGESGVGKTTLLKYLYIESINRGYIPLMVEKRDYRDGRIDRMFKGLFEEQYGLTRGADYDLYLQADDQFKIIFIDDINLIANQTARKNLISNILDSGKLLIYTTSEKNYDLEQAVKDKLQGKTISSIEIQLFFKETRDQLVKSVASLSHRNEDEIHTIREALDYIAQCQTDFFNFTPASLLQYIRFLLNASAEQHKGVQTISMVFETNIRNAIIAASKNEATANIYLAALEFLADRMYFELRVESIKPEELERIIKEFNTKKKAKINGKELLSVCVSARLLRESERSFEVKFYDNSTYAYFVAKAINREFEKNPDNRDKFRFVMNNICFGINDSIILFLSFIRNNTAIILKTAEESVELLSAFPEWDFEKRNIPFLHQTDVTVESVPSADEKRNAHKKIEQIEKERYEAVKFRSVFDYDPDDGSKPEYVLAKAIKYIHLVGRALVDQYGSLEADEIEPILDALFSVPQKAVFAILKPYQDHYEELVSRLFQFAKEHKPDEKISEKKIRKLLGQFGTMIALNILNDVAYDASNCSTINVLRERANGNANQRVLELMMEENTGVTSEFVSRAIDLFKELRGIPYAAWLISEIAKKHITFKEDVDHKYIDKLVSSGVISSKATAVLLQEQKDKGKS